MTWFKNGQPLPATIRYTPNYDLQTGVASLKIPDAALHDTGSYEVVAENPVGRDSTRCNILVNHSPDIDKRPMVDPNAFKYIEAPSPQTRPRDELDADSAPPIVIVPLSDAHVREGEPTTFQCKITGKPNPTIRWLKNGAPLMESIRFV